MFFCSGLVWSGLGERGKGQVFPIHAMTYKGIEVYFYSFLISAPMEVNG
jgi:hypothetical protein